MPSTIQGILKKKNKYINKYDSEVLVALLPTSKQKLIDIFFLNNEADYLNSQLNVINSEYLPIFLSQFLVWVKYYLQ